jgi:hypothetical protein
MGSTCCWRLGVSPKIALLPPQEGVHYDDPSHRYHLWAPSRNKWVTVSSVSQVLTRSGGKGFDRKFWRQSLIDKRGLHPHEADVYMDHHSSYRAIIGTELHALIRAELLGLSHYPHHAESLLLLGQWRMDFMPRLQEVAICESPLISRSMFYSGTPDLLAMVDGRWMLVDWKTKASKEKAKPDAAWGLQLAGYALLVEEQYGIRVDGALNLMIWTDGSADFFWNRADIDQQSRKFIGYLARSHQIQAEGGSSIHAGALAHLLAAHPNALDQVAAPA